MTCKPTNDPWFMWALMWANIAEAMLFTHIYRQHLDSERQTKRKN